MTSKHDGHCSLLARGVRRVTIVAACMYSLTGCGNGSATSASDDSTGIGGGDEFIAPVSAPFPSPVVGGRFGYYANGERAGYSPNHYGLDFPVSSGTTVFASRGGQVRRADASHPCFGGLVIVEHDQVPNRGFHYYTLYAHMGGIAPGVVSSPSTRVEAGDALGVSGNSGTCTDGSHLHFELIESPTPLSFNESGNTGQGPNYDSWKDPALHIRALRSFAGPGPGGTIANLPATFDITRAGGSRDANNNRTQWVEWEASAGATEYVVLEWYFPVQNYIFPEWDIGADPPGAALLISPVLGPDERRFEWAPADPPAGTYWIKVRARNSAGTRTNTVASGFGIVE